MRNKLKDIFNNPATVKIISVCIAIILWVYIQTVQTPEKDHKLLPMNVSYVNASLLQEQNLIVMDEEAFKTEITVNCSRLRLAGISEKDFSVYVDLSEITSAGTVELPIKVRLENNNVHITDYSPATVKIKVDKVVTVEKQLERHITGKLKNNCYIDESMIVSGSDVVSVKGPASLISEIDKGIIPIDLSGKDKSFNETCKVVLLDKEGNAVTDERITVLNGDIPVEVTVLKTKLLPVSVPGIPEDVKYSINPSKVEIAGPADVIKDMESVEAKGFVLLSKEKGYSQNVKISLSKDLVMLSDVVPRLTVTE